MRERLLTNVLLVVFWVASNDCCGSLVVDSSLLSVTVAPFGTSSVSDSASIDSNPYQHFHNAAFELSFANASHNFSWQDDVGSFQSETAQHIAAMHGSVSTIVAIDVLPAVGSLLTIESFYSFQHPVQSLGSAFLTVQILDHTTGEFLFDRTEVGGTFVFGPPSGMLNVTESILLTAGTQYSLRYGSSSTSWSVPLHGEAWNGTGVVDFVISPVPEPATLAMLALAVPVALSRTVRRVAMDRVK